MPKFWRRGSVSSSAALSGVFQRALAVYARRSPNTICHLLHHTCAVCSSQWPFLWSFYMPLPSPLCALVNVRRTRRMDGCVKSRRRCARWLFLPGKPSFFFSMSRMYETYRFLTNVWAQPWNYWEIHHHHLVSVRSSSGGEQTPKTPIERAPRSRWREKRNKERGDQRQSLRGVKKKKKKRGRDTV